MIKADNLTKTFGQTKAVDGLSFEIKKGEIVGLLGPNGAGKTTTMRLLTGYLFPDKGKITINGLIVSENPVEVQEIIGYLPENNPLYKEMLVSDFLNFSASLRGISGKKRKKALDFVVDSIGIAKIYYRPIGELSKGFKQRVGLAAVILHQPQILIMDEPTEGLDPNQRTEIRNLIRTLGKTHTVILSTHVMQEASAICSRMIIINQGKLVAEGDSRQLSLKAKNKRIFDWEIEGRQVESLLAKIKGVEHLEAKKIGTDKFKGILTVGTSAVVQPEISRLAGKKGWVIWRLAEKEHGLEEIFRKLTGGREE